VYEIESKGSDVWTAARATIVGTPTETTAAKQHAGTVRKFMVTP
jgi:hypothetical protein